VSSVEVEGATRAAAHLAEMGARAADPRPAKPALDAIFSVDSRERFDREGPVWAALDQESIDQKARAGLDTRILRATGALYASLTAAAGAETRDYRESFAFGTDIPYARFHQYGTVNMPVRRPVDLSVVARREMEEVISTYVAKGLP